MKKQTIIRKAHPTWQIPDFNEDTIFAKRRDYCICVFVINEGERIQKQLENMKPLKRWISLLQMVVAPMAL